MFPANKTMESHLQMKNGSENAAVKKKRQMLVRSNFKREWTEFQQWVRDKFRELCELVYMIIHTWYTIVLRYFVSHCFRLVLSFLGVTVDTVKWKFYIVKEYICCQKLDACVRALNCPNVLAEMNNPSKCMVLHPGFEAVCLSKWSLRSASPKYRTIDGHKYRQIGTRQN